MKTEILLAHLVCSLINSLHLHIAVFNSLCFFFLIFLGCLNSSRCSFFLPLIAYLRCFHLVLVSLSLYSLLFLGKPCCPYRTSCVLFSVPRVLPGQRLPCGIWPVLRKNPSSPVQPMRPGLMWHPRRNRAPTSTSHPALFRFIIFV